MVYGWGDYISEKNEENHHAKNFVVVAIIAVFVFCVFILNVLLIHPWIKSSIDTIPYGNKSAIAIVFENVGNMKDYDVIIDINSNDISCDFNIPETCFGSEKGASCKMLERNTKIIYICNINAESTEIRTLMKSRYQTIRNLYICNNGGFCLKDDSPVYGSSAILWNYILFYPIDRIFNNN